MESLNNIAAFIQAAESRSFTKAAQQLGISASAVGKTIARMEANLGVTLFHRNTRNISLTPEGKIFLERCHRIFCEFECAKLELLDATANPKGKLKISLPRLNEFIMPVIAGFMKQYPEIELELNLSNRMVNVIEEGFDAVIRTGEQKDSRLISRFLGDFHFKLVAAPAYFQQHGIPTYPQELTKHACLFHKTAHTGKLDSWQLSETPPDFEQTLTHTLVCNTLEPLVYAALQGVGIAYLPDYLVKNYLAGGKLQSVLHSYVNHSNGFWMLWPENRHKSPKLRVLIDYLVSHFLSCESNTLSS